MRYSFHGKVRATGQTIDGFIEAETASLAIDRLADKGIIGVYSVRPDPKPNKAPTGAPGEQPAFPGGASDRRNPRALTNGRSAAYPTPPTQTPPVPQTPPPAVAPQAPVAPTSNDAATADLLKALAEKIANLTGKVETMLAKPASVIYQQGPARDREGPVRGPKRAPRIAGEQQTSTLRDIFQNNLDLRHSLEKLASSVGGAPIIAKDQPVKPNNGSHAGTNGSANGSSANGSSNGVTNGASNGSTKVSSEPVSKTRAVVNPAHSA